MPPDPYDVVIHSVSAPFLFFIPIIPEKLSYKTDFKRAGHGERPARAKRAGGPFGFCDYLLLRRQMPIFSALWISSSRKSGWAMEMMASARSQVDSPFRLTIPYSVTM